MPNAIPLPLLALFQQELVGTWANLNFGLDAQNNPVGGPDNPLSYCLMPLPQPLTALPTPGYILKNFTYHEVLKFNGPFNPADPGDPIAIAAEAANRGGIAGGQAISQNCRALFYEQQVQFTQGPATSSVIHVENGCWLSLPEFVQQDGPYAGTYDPAAVPPYMQDIDMTPAPEPMLASIARQTSVPHGNSILALGTADLEFRPGAPTIPVAVSSLPVGLTDTEAYTTQQPQNLTPPAPGASRADILDYQNYQNPSVSLTLAPNQVLQQAVDIIQPDSFLFFSIGTDSGGSVTNIPFEQKASNVSGYSAEFWIMKKGSKKYLAYTQTILMVFTINGVEITFPHITANTVTFGG